jgi:LPXTG-site transpeptidase (sortase) family protein
VGGQTTHRLTIHNKKGRYQMKFRLTKTRVLIAAATLMLVVAAFVIVSAHSGLPAPRASKVVSNSSNNSVNAPSIFKAKQSRGQFPARLIIPSIKVNAAIDFVGLTRSGAMGNPIGRVRVAWYDLGPRPGALGSAVIAGHRGRSARTPTVFDHLSSLRAGDLVYVKDAKGATVTFIVRNSRVYDASTKAPEVFSSASGAHLNLITCDGSWDKANSGFTKRIVVFTDRQG